MPYEPKGTVALYQGVPCDSVVFVRRRGIAADRTLITIPAGEWSKLVVADFTRDQLKKRPAVEVPDRLSTAFDVSAVQKPLELPTKLEGEGTLVLAEASDRKVAIAGLVVIKVETDQVNADGTGFVKLDLVDERFFWSRGILRRFSFNELREDGTTSKDTLKPDGERWTLGDVLRENVLPSLWRKPEAGFVTSGFSAAREVAFPYLGRAARALSQLGELAGATDPCLSNSGQVSLYKPGEGLLGEAKEGEPVNTVEIPPDVIKDADQRGRRYVLEKGWPEECFVFVGRERVASVAVDGWEPVIVQDGRPYFLSEELVRALTKGKKGLAWLQKFVLLPSADQGVEGVDDRVLKLFREQAYRLWRLPGVETVGKVSKEDLEAALQLPKDDPARQALEAQGEAGYYTGSPGQNAHLLPLLERAETVSGRRTPVTVEAYSFETKRARLRATTSGAALIAVREKQAEIRRSVRSADLSGSKRDPFSYASPPVIDSDSGIVRLFGGGKVDGLSLSEMLGGSVPPGVDVEAVERYMREQRRVDLIRQTNPDLARRYEQSLSEEAKALTESGDGTADESLRLAKTLVGFEKEAAKDTAAEDLIPGADEQAGLRGKFRQQFSSQAAQQAGQSAKRAERARRQRTSRQEAGVGPQRLQGPAFLQPKARAVDTGARVYSAELGIVRTSFLAGHPREPEVHVPTMTSLQPLPVRVIFGAKLRPQIDRPQPKPSDRPRTGSVSPQEFTHKTLGLFYEGPFRLDHVIPKVLGEESSYYVSAWTRTALGRVEVTALEQVPWDRATRVDVRWQELVALNGSSNRDQLDKAAKEAAVERSKTEETIRSEDLTLVGPWNVQCDGLISRVEIRMERENDAPCGFTTKVTVGGKGSTDPTSTRTRTRS